ncbi:MAG: hypothetical protein K9J13_03695 [Saprospiraceae bacterium]|nr:hypothetical protein [Saprospiraceae bacterium]
MNNRVFIGLSNTSNISSGFAMALRSIGIKAKSYEYQRYSSRFDQESGKTLFLIKDNGKTRIFNKNIIAIINNVIKYIHLFIHIPFYNVYFFSRHSTFLPDMKDLRILKFFRKKIFLLFVGCPERNPNYENGEKDFICKYCKNEELKENCSCRDITEKRRIVNINLKYCDKIFALEDVGDLSNVKPTFWMAAIENLEPEYLDEKYSRNKLLISHLPSNSLYKQTDIIEPILKRIALKYQEVEIIIKKEYWSREEIIKTLQKTHILVESLSGITYGVIGAEAMSAGCVVMSSYPQFISKYHDFHAIVKVTSENLYDVLCEYIEDRVKLKSQAKKSIEFYNKYHSYKAVGKYLQKEMGL